MYVNPAIPRMRIRPTLTVIPFLCHFALFASLNIFERYVSLVFHYGAAPFRARPVINLVFGRLCRKTVFRGREGTKVWYRETMFSQVVSHSGRKNVMSMRGLFSLDPLAGFEKMAGFQIFSCLKIKCFHS